MFDDFRTKLIAAAGALLLSTVTLAGTVGPVEAGPAAVQNERPPVQA